MRAGADYRPTNSQRSPLSPHLQNWRRLVQESNRRRRGLLKIVERSDDLRTRERFREPVVDIDKFRTVLDRVLEDSHFLVDGSVELPASFPSPAGCNNGQRQAIPARVDGFSRLVEVVETHFDAVRP